jgi:hypothetical protein
MLRRPTLRALSFFAAALSPLFAQTIPNLSSQYSSGAIPYGESMYVSAYPATTGEPFHAEVNARKVESRPDGKQVIYESHGILARDSGGRIFREQLPSPVVPRAKGKGVSVLHAITIWDPVAMAQIQWDDQANQPLPTKTAIKMPLTKGPPFAANRVLDACERENGATRSYPNGETQKIEDLGERTIQGIPARGCRVSTFIPVGAIGNEQSYTVTDDSWTSYEMRLTLLKLHHDPVAREDETVELDNITRAEPAPTLFQAPPDYQIRDLEEEKRQAERSQMLVVHPELFAGPWETQDPKSGAIDGIFLWATTEVRQSAEYLQQLQIKVYRRQGEDTKQGWFTANEGTDTIWDGKRLRLKFQPTVAGDISLDLDLTFDVSQKIWTGTFGREGTTREVRLQRPGNLAGTSNRFAGDWFLHAGSSSDVTSSAFCIHVTEERDSTLIAWEDRKSARVINAPTVNQYGTELAVQSAQLDAIALAVATSLYFGNRVSFTGTLASDGSRIEGRWATNGQPSPKSIVLIKSSGEGFSSSFSPF